MSTCSGNCGSCGKSGNCEDEKKPSRLLNIKHKLLVLSGKGGVGKSTVAASLAVLLARAGKKTALLDLDFHGPSQPTIFGLSKERLGGNENGIEPAMRYGVRIVSLGLLLDNPNAAVIWRGPAKIGVINQLFEEVDWGGDLDYLVLDFPPGTGDEVLSACQTIPGDRKAVIVTTPQEVSLADCRKCIDFCRKLDVPIAGIIENMSCFICPDCHRKHALFLSGGGETLSDAYGCDLLASLPLEPAFVRACDEGRIDEGLQESPVLHDELTKAVHSIIGKES